MSGWLSRLFDTSAVPQDYTAPANQLGPLARQVMANPVGTETTSPYASQSVGVPSGPFNPIEAMTPNGPMLGTDVDRAHEIVRQGIQEYAPTLLGMVGDAPGGKLGGMKQFELDPYDLKAADNLTPARQKAVDHYSNLSTYVNEGEGPEVDALRGHLDDAINGSRLSSDGRLYRGFSVPREHMDQVTPGSTVELGPGYVSTTTSKDVARNFANDDMGGDASVLVEIRAPKGHPALYVPTSPEIENEFGVQHEVLLPRHTKFQVHSVNEKSDGRFDVLASPVAGTQQPSQ